MSKRQNLRAMRPNAYDPWQHNRDVRLRKQVRRLGLIWRTLARQFERLAQQVAATHVAGVVDTSIVREIEGFTTPL